MPGQDTIMRSSTLVRRLAIGLGSLVLLLLVALLAVGWYYADLILDGALVVKDEPDKHDVEVIAVGGGRITLRSTTGEDIAGEPETIGLAWPDGYARAGSTLSSTEDTVTREYVPLEGGLQVGDLVRFDESAFPGDPERAHGIAFDAATFAAPLGELAAWQVDGADDTWAVFVHGKGSDRRETLRMMPVMVDAGLPSLAITYRNDPGAPADPSSYYEYGRTEWKDLEAAVEYALAEGAADVVLVGYSMGGGIVASFLTRSPFADRVAGAILDSPMLDLGSTIDLRAEQRGLPGFLTGIAKVITSLRFDVDWDALDYVSRADELSVPILLFHGDGDKSVPQRTSEALAEARPDLVTHEAFDGAAHVKSWNADPERYEEAVAAFLERVAR
ncbi:MAG: alpha/beta fold hydrolase [Chloroflexi bacterium]|nr:alpha/beta fold hydrolase [Chloroflexota bacterium]